MAGRVRALYLFDVGDAIDVRALPSLVDATAAAPLTLKAGSPPYLQYQQPPIVIEGATIGVTAAEHHVRFKVYDYGVVSVAVTASLPSVWDDILDLGQRWQDNPRILAEAERCCRELLRHIGAAVTAPRPTLLREDYVIFVISSEPGGETAETLLASRGAPLAHHCAERAIR